MCSFEQKISEEVTASRSERRKDMSLGARLSDGLMQLAMHSVAQKTTRKRKFTKVLDVSFCPDSSATGLVFPSLKI